MPAYRESFVFRLETDDVAMLWTGFGPLLLPADDIIPAPAVIPGAGELINVPELEQLINGLAQRLEARLSGVSDEAIALATEEALQVPGAPAYIGRISFDEDWQIVSVEWEWAGEGKSLTVSSEPSESGRTRTLVLTLGAGDTTRGRAPLAFFTDADQRRDFPDDNFFSHVAGMFGGTSRRWGPK